MSQNSAKAARLSLPDERTRLVGAMVVAIAVMLSLAFSTFSVLESEAQEVSPVTGWTPMSLQAEAEPSNAALSVADVAERSNPFVVTIYTYVDASSAQQLPGLRGSLPGQSDGAAPGVGSQVALGAGSGWIYSADGYVITNAHVVSGADTFVVEFSDGSEGQADLVGTDTIQDVAVLQLQLAEGETAPVAAPVGDSAAMRAGEEVVAIGSPLGQFTNSVSDGIIGGLNRSLDSGNGLSLANLIQHDAEISSGNSGGPLLNMQGEVIGMNVAKIDTASVSGASVSGLNFAIDGNTVVERAQEIIETNASIAYPFLGVQTQLAEQGLVIVDVMADGPAAISGLQAGDILVGIDGEAADDDISFLDLLMQHRPGDTVAVQVERQGETVTLDVSLGERPVESQA